MKTKKCDVLIIGKGVVGSNFGKEIEALNPEFTDKYKGIVAEKSRHALGVVCVDTPLKNGSLDVTEVENAIIENDCDIYLIKSTCPVGNVNRLKEKTGKRIVYSPEYYGGTQHCNNFEFDFTILGGDKQDCHEIIQMLQMVYDGRHQFRTTTAETAELVKFMVNSFLAAKVVFCNDFYRAAEKAGVEYEELRELFILDKRVGESHTFVYKDAPYFDSHCLNKDVPAIANQFGMEFLSGVVETNLKWKGAANETED